MQALRLCIDYEIDQDTLTTKVILYDLGEYYIRVEFCHNDNISLIHISQKKSSEWFWIYLMIYAARVCRHVRNELIQNLTTYSIDFTYQMGYSSKTLGDKCFNIMQDKQRYNFPHCRVLFELRFKSDKHAVIITRYVDEPFLAATTTHDELT